MEPLEQLAPDVWVASRPLRIFVGDVGARMTVLRLPDGVLMLHSPVPLDAALQRALEERGRVRWLIGPRKVHHLVLEAFVGPRPKGNGGRHGAKGSLVNSLDNLRWGTQSANVQDAVAAGTYMTEKRAAHLRKLNGRRA